MKKRETSKRNTFSENHQLTSRKKLQVLGNIGSRHQNNIEELKEKLRKGYLKRTRKLLKTKLCRRNLMKGINTWAAPPPCKILWTLLKMDKWRTWTSEELGQMNLRTRKLLTIHNALHTERWRRLCHISKKDEEEDSPALRIVYMHNSSNREIN